MEIMGRHTPRPCLLVRAGFKAEIVELCQRGDTLASFVGLLLTLRTLVGTMRTSRPLTATRSPADCEPS